MRFAFVSLGALLMIPACTAPANKNATATTGNGAADGEASTFQPGEWEITQKLDMPPAQLTGRPTPPGSESDRNESIRRICLTAEQASAISPMTMIEGSQNSDCKADILEMADGNINARMICAGHAEDIREVPVRAYGSYDSTSYSLTVEQTALGFTFKTLIHAERVGECEK